jgi:hypothetical protein
MPPIMQTLLQIYPEYNGWFVEEPLTVHPMTPEKAQPFFETFRVVVPDINALDLAVGKLLAAANTLPIRKIKRHDRKPNAPGLPGFRGVWCQTEDKEMVGFSIITSNQNRFLIWARYQYYEAWGHDDIKSKVRDHYARNLGQYFASLDTGVPDTQPPRAVSRTLPSWFDLHRPPPDIENGKNKRELTDEQMTQLNEIHAWGLHSAVSFTPTERALARFIEERRDTLWTNQRSWAIQHVFTDYAAVGYSTANVVSLGSTTSYHFDNHPYNFAVDRYGRIRIILPPVLSPSSIDPATGERRSWGMGLTALLFPGSPVLSAGRFNVSSADIAQLGRVSPSGTFYAPSLTDRNRSFPETLALKTRFIESFGHLFAALRGTLLYRSSVTISAY